MIKEDAVESRHLKEPKRRLCLRTKNYTAEETSTSISSIPKCLLWSVWLSSSHQVYQYCSQSPLLAWSSNTQLIECSWLTLNIDPLCMTTRWTHLQCSFSRMPPLSTCLWAPGCTQTKKLFSTVCKHCRKMRYSCKLSTILAISGDNCRLEQSFSSICWLSSSP